MFNSCILIPFYIFSVLLKQKSKIGVNEFEFNGNMENKEEMNNLKGLINELMCVLQARTSIKTITLKNENDDV